MDALGNRLVHLLNGDFVRLDTPEFTVTAEVVTNEQTQRAGVESGAADRHTIRFMPVGEDATRVSADRLHVTVNPQADDTWVVGPLVAEVFDEDQLSYKSEPRGEITGLEVLDLSE